ncbi:hypothetical protein F4810DRAFT_724500 [Camillea tinctor]|nr:hypothetical protein F4810DRAFT_724500 [Camillea tinctor]
MDLLLADPRYVQSNQVRKGMLREKLADLVDTLFDGNPEDLPTVEEAAGAALGATLGAPTTRNRNRRYIASNNTSPTPQGRSGGSQTTTFTTPVIDAHSAAATPYAIDIDDDENANDDEERHVTDPFDKEIRRLLFVDEKKKKKKKKKRDDSSSSSSINLRGVFMTLKDDMIGLSQYVSVCSEKARQAEGSEEDWEAYLILTEVQKGLRIAQRALGKVSLPGPLSSSEEVWDNSSRCGQTLVFPEVMELD